MKKALFALFALFIVHLAQSQIVSGVPIYHLNGKIGIGTSSPFSTFEVNANGNSDGMGIYDVHNGVTRIYAWNKSSATNSSAQLMLNAGSTSFGDRGATFTYKTVDNTLQIANTGDPNSVISFYNRTSTNSNERMRLHSNGNFGVGTTNPLDQFHLSNAGANTRLRVGNNAAYDQLLYFNGQVDWSVGMDQSNGNAFTIASTSTLDYNQRVTLKTDGSFGIGSNNPLARLHIKSGSAFNTSETASGQDLILLQSPNPGNGGYFGGITWRSGGRRRAAIVATQEHSDTDYVGIAFLTKGTDGPGDFYESMRLTRNGNLGIGTDSPGEKLEVNGTIRSKKVKVEASPWPDYVFEPNYKLRSLNSLERYITANKHLPEVPSAAEVEKEGIDLGNMDATLLKKVEELTLYLIEQNKRLEKVEAKNQQLKAEIKALKKQ